MLDTSLSPYDNWTPSPEAYEYLKTALSKQEPPTIQIKGAECSPRNRPQMDEEEIRRALICSEPLESKYEILEEVGVGSFGKVNQARCRSSGRMIAIKSMCKEANPYALREIQAMAKVNHEGVAPLLAAFEDEDTFFVVMPCYKGPDLFDRIACNSSQIDERMALQACVEMLEALEGVRLANYAHLDVKPENFVYRDDGKLVLVDFGSAEPLQQKNPLDRRIGSADYLPPEVAADSQFHETTDVWGAGVTLYVMLKQALPYRMTNLAQDDEQPMYDEVSESLQQLYWVSENTRYILSRMLQMCPNQRVTAKQILPEIKAHLRILSRPKMEGGIQIEEMSLA
jgi:serine/threonine protein kinase